MFNRFWRADPARARTTGGTGLGLAIALEDARLHGGWLQAWGERGKGSVFRLSYLPGRAGQELARLPAAGLRPRTSRRRDGRLRPRESPARRATPMRSSPWLAPPGASADTVLLLPPPWSPGGGLMGYARQRPG